MSTSELSFLIDLLMNHKLPKPTKDLIAARIREVEAGLYKPISSVVTNQPVNLPINLVNQAPSTIAAMIKHGELPQSSQAMAPQIPATPVENIAQTPATMQAMLDRQKKINMAGKIDPTATRPPKF